MKSSSLLICLILISLYGCNGLEYSPNQVFNGDSPTNVNAANVARLQDRSKDDTIRFVLCGDTQREYANTEDMVTAINNIGGVDMTFIAGDISDFGLLLEMDLVKKKLDKLNMPYIGVIGNHDHSAKGVDVFKRMFGPTNFSFIYQGVKFITHDTNSREVDFDGTLPDMDWLRKQLAPQDGVNAYVTVAHVPPQDADFDQHLSDEYINIINGTGKTLAALYAHTHRQELYYPHDEKIPYIITDAVEHRNFILLEIIDNKLSFRKIYY